MTPSTAQTPADEVKSALERAKEAAEKQKKDAAENAKSVEEKLRAERTRTQQVAELEADARGKPTAQKRIEWQGVGMLRAGFSEEKVIRTLTRGGTVIAWGGNGEGQRAVPAGLNNVVAVGAGANHTVALKQDGTVVAWGENTSGQSTVPVGLRDVVSVAAGFAHTVALKTDGAVVAWGYNGKVNARCPRD